MIAPLSANSLAKMANGMAGNLLLSVIRAWDTTGEIDGKKKTIIVAPAMNTAMWRHPVTNEHLAKLEADWGIRGTSKEGWIEVLRPVEKTLACGDSGDGAMREWSEVVSVIQDRLSLPPSEQKHDQDLAIREKNPKPNHLGRGGFDKHILKTS